MLVSWSIIYKKIQREAQLKPETWQCTEMQGERVASGLPEYGARARDLRSEQLQDHPCQKESLTANILSIFRPVLHELVSSHLPFVLFPFMP